MSPKAAMPNPSRAPLRDPATIVRSHPATGIFPLHKDAPPRLLANICKPAESLITSALVQKAREEGGITEGVIWILCQDIRAQERLHQEMATWQTPSHFLPELESLPDEAAIADPELAAERLHVLHTIARSRHSPDRDPPVVVLVRDSLDDEVSAPSDIAANALTLQTSQKLPMQTLRASLEEAGYEAAPQVNARGQFAIRGGIFDVFPIQAGAPLRIEFFGDEIDSLREFDIHSQSSTQRLDHASILLGPADESSQHLRTWISPDDFVIAVGTEDDAAHLRTLDAPDPENDPHHPSASPPLETFERPVGSFDAGDFLISEAKHQAFCKQISQWQSDGWQVRMFFRNEAEAGRFNELMAASPETLAAITTDFGDLSFGFSIPSLKLVVLTAAELLGRFHVTRSRKRFNREAAHRRVRHEVDIADLCEGDHVVHAEYGIALYRGLRKEPHDDNDTQREVMVLEYADQAKLYVPVEQSHLISRYVGVAKKKPTLTKLGDARWKRLRHKTESAIEDYASRLLEIQALRNANHGHSHPPDNRWQYEFEHSFPYRETPDQLKSIRETKADMESPRPMDRLICGDVGFGKTEVAIRAAFKAVMGGTQVAILAPTTVLAHQHARTFRERMSDYPVRIELLTRLQSKAEQREVVRHLAEGTIDIVIGTHRLVSNDVHFAKLGLVVVDEEQRFGVKHKETFKQRFHLVDVLTLSATPIPRTLYLSLMGAREMSTIETPPPNRMPVQTTVCAYDERVIKSAIERELKRRGQVFFLHNRIHSIEKVKKRLAELVPGARVLAAHGQMDRRLLENLMQTFVQGDADILVATTIIESGIDIPNANTLIIDRADRFGLADLYQLRGRVGRAEHKAYAYLMLPRDLLGVGDSRKRMHAIKQYSSLGAGFKIAMRDLEIRGAGNLLGTKQSGHIAAIGFDLYCQLLKQSIAKLNGQPHGPRLDVVLHVDFLTFSEATSRSDSKHTLQACLPGTFISEPSLRIAAYRDLARCSTHKELQKLKNQWQDRFGPLPPQTHNLIAASALKIAAAHANISVVEIRDSKLMLTRNGDYILLQGKFPRLQQTQANKKLSEAIDMVKHIR